MTIERQDISEDFYQGNYKEIVHTTYEADEVTPKNLTSAEVIFSVFNDDHELQFTKTSENAGEITITDAVNGVSKIFLQPEDTLWIYGTFRYQINVVDSNGHEETVTTGKLNIFRLFARRPRKTSQSAYTQGG